MPRAFPFWVAAATEAAAGAALAGLTSATGGPALAMMEEKTGAEEEDAAVLSKEVWEAVLEEAEGAAAAAAPSAAGATGVPAKATALPEWGEFLTLLPFKVSTVVVVRLWLFLEVVMDLLMTADLP